MPQCRKLRPIRKFIPTATQPRVRRVPPSKRAASPFESLLDDGASQSKTDECKSPSANDRTTTKKADETDCVGADAEDGAPSDGIKVTPGPVLVEDASGTENSKPRAKRSRRPPQIPVIRRLCRPQ